MLVIRNVLGTKCLADILSEREKIANWMEVFTFSVIINEDDSCGDGTYHHHHLGGVHILSDYGDDCCCGEGA